MTIGQLAARTGLSVRTLRFYADAGVIPEAGRTGAGYRRFGPDAVARARLVRTLRELGVGLDDVKRVLTAEASLADVAAAHARAIDAQIRTLRLQRAVLRPVAAELRIGAPELPEDPTADQVAAWVELAVLLRDPDFIASSRRMAERARAEGHEPDVAQFEVGQAVGEHAGAAVRAGVAPESPEGFAVVERLDAMAAKAPKDRAEAAERIEAFTDRRVARYWTLVGIVNDWPQAQTPPPDEVVDAWEWYARALRAHA